MRKIRETVLVTVAVATAFMVSAFAGGIGVVDMDQLIKLHPSTEVDHAILQKYVKEFEADRNDILNQIKKESDELEELSKSAEDVGLSQKALDEKRALAKAKVMKIRQLQRKAREMADDRQKSLTSQELQMRKRVVADIRKIVAKIAAEKNLDLVLDNTGVGIGGYNPVIYNSEKFDITDEVIKRLPKSADDK